MHLPVKKLQNCTIKVFRNKQVFTNVSLIFLSVLRGVQPIRKLQQMYLPFKNQKIQRIEGNKTNEKQEKSNTDLFAG